MSHSHYSDPRPNVGSAPRRTRWSTPEGGFSLETDRGVFSFGQVDRGTDLLVSTAATPSPTVSGDILDIGCGYGPIALAFARRLPERTVWAIDVNGRARELTERNAVVARINNIRVASPEDVDADVKFAAIYSNPPTHVGRDAMRELLVGWFARLTPGGIAWIVVSKHLGADSLAAWLVSEGYDVHRRRSRQAYRVLQITPPADGPQATSTSDDAQQ